MALHLPMIRMLPSVEFPLQSPCPLGPSCAFWNLPQGQVAICSTTGMRSPSEVLLALLESILEQSLQPRTEGPHTPKP